MSTTRARMLFVGLCGGLVALVSVGGCKKAPRKGNKLPLRTPLLHRSLQYQREHRQDSTVTVAYRSSAFDLHDYYARIIPKLGWKKKSELRPEDRTKCGGDWGGYYERGPLRMRFHICGSRGAYAYGKNGRMRRLRVRQDVWITTWGFHPRQLLGRNYKHPSK